MREIKFRCWNVAGEKMTYDDEWCYGWSHIKHAHEAGRIILMQYTGIKDKNGVEIYEGDILKHDELGVCAIEWARGRVCFEQSPSLSWSWVGYEVIGNIYENPELLS